MTNELLQISIKDYLEGIGVQTKKEGNKYFASSPFSRDTNWSFVIYPTNTYFDFSTGHGGNIINLVAHLGSYSLSEAAKQLKDGIRYEKYKPNYRKVKEELYKTERFDITKYITKNTTESNAICAYADTRGISEGYECGVFFTRSKDKWIRNPAIAFVHVNKKLEPCGIKFRKITPSTPEDQSPRFSARGQLGFYILPCTPSITNELLLQSPILYIVESESSANSLMMFLRGQVSQKSWIILSRGGVSSAPSLEDLPEQLQELTKKLIIDYDGNEELYNQRLRLYSGLNAQPIKLILPKGEDINSLYVKNEMWKIEQLLLN